MDLLSLTPLLVEAQKGHYAVGAYNFCNVETAQAIIWEGQRRQSPVMMIIGPEEVPLIGAKMLVHCVQMVADTVDVPVCLHLDHAHTIDEIKECIEAGFPSVMIDASTLSFEDNVRLTKSVVQLARPYGVTVEGELGAVGRVGVDTNEGKGSASLTDPDKAVEFVERTGVDALAVAIGNAHGLYTQMPELDLERLQRIREKTDTLLVLHGGSGTPVDQLHRAIEIGISKVNVASELARAYKNAFTREGAKPWYIDAILEGKAGISEVVGRWMGTLMSEGKAAALKV